jgi:exodeoxyribonuclease VII small subunit
VSNARKPINFEKSLADLEALVERMEDGNLSLEESLKAFENGIRLTKQCQQALTEAQQRVQMLVQQNEGLQAVAFDQAPDDDADGADDADDDGDDDEDQPD